MSLLSVAEPAPPRSLYAVNATPSSVTLLWVEEGVVDHYQVLCRASGGREELKVSPHQARPGGQLQHHSLPELVACGLFQGRQSQMVNAQVVTVTGLMPSSTYNCTITSFSFSSASKPATVSITTAGRWRCEPPTAQHRHQPPSSCVRS